MPSFTYTFILKSAQPFDGTFINSNVIRDIRKYQFDIRSMLLGTLQNDRTRISKYTYKGKNHSIQELADIEKQMENDPQFKLLLTQMLADFEKISKPFEEQIQDARPILKQFVMQSNEIRNRKNSLLHKWSECSAANERELLEAHLQTIQEFNIFLTDLCNFLTDIVESCPKAYSQWRKAKNAR